MTEKFFTDIFFPQCVAQNVKTVLHFGDTFDKRKNINIQTLERSKRFYFDPLRDRGMRQETVIGNHDTFFKTTNNLNSVDEIIVPEYGNVRTYKRPVEVVIDGAKFLILPWIPLDPQAMSETLKAIENSKAEYCVGHLEINGFHRSRMDTCKDGLKRSLFDKFKLTLSGHFHHRDLDGDIGYLGSPYGMTWEDYGAPRGFHFLDVETGELEFIENPYTAFNKITVDETNVEQIKEQLNNLQGSYIKLNIQKKSLEVETLLESLQGMDLADLSITDETVQKTVTLSDVSTDVEDTPSILSKTIDEIEDLQVNKTKLKELVMSIYNEALTVDA